MIKLKNVNKSYFLGNKEIPTLKNINIEINNGEFVSIMGPSGSGKSTLINIIGFLDEKFQGKYLFQEHEINIMSHKDYPHLRNNNVGFIFQNFKLINNISVWENVGLPLLYSGKNHNDIMDQIKSQLDKVGLQKHFNDLPSTLSGGQQQRVAIARALITNPTFLVADEPTGALDSENSETIMNLFKEFNSTGTTIIMVTHDPIVASKSDRIIQILDGKIIGDEVLNS